MPSNSDANRYGWLRQYIGVIMRLDDGLVDALNQLNRLLEKIEVVENGLRWCQSSMGDLDDDDFKGAVEKLQDFKLEVATQRAFSRHLLKFLRSYEVLVDAQKRTEPPT